MRPRNVMKIILIAAAIFATGGCERAEPATPARPLPTAPKLPEIEEIQPTETTPEKKVINWLVRSGYGEDAWQDTVVLPLWTETHPDIELNIIRLSEEEAAVRLAAMKEAGEPVHVWSPSWIDGNFGTARASGLIQDLMPLIERDNYDLSDFPPALLDIYRSQDGALWGMPFTSSGSYVFYNVDFFDWAGVAYPPTDWDDPNWTWEAFVQLAHEVMQNYEDGDIPVYGAVAIAELLETPPMLWGQTVWPDGMWATGFAREVTLTDDRSVEAYQAFHDLVFIEQVAPSPEATLPLNALGGTFVSGQVAMQIQGGWGVWAYKDLITDAMGFCWGIAPLPSGRPDAVDRAVLWTEPWVISAGLSREDVDLAWEFIKFLLSPEQMLLFADLVGKPPARSSTLAEYAMYWSPCQPGDEFQAVFEGAFAHGREASYEMLVHWQQLRQVWSERLDPWWVQPVGNAEEVLTLLEQEIRAALRDIQ